MSASPTNFDVSYCVATPPGRAAVATIIVCGTGALDCVSHLFRPRNSKKILRDQLGRIVYGNWMNGEENGEDLVVCARSSTWVDVHCHGGKSAPEIISNSLEQAGAKRATVQQIAACTMGSEYFADLALTITQAQTQRTAKYLLAQPNLHREFWQKTGSLIDARNQENLKMWLGDFLKWQRFGKQLTVPSSVVFCGAPNVGKSSLVNAILGFQRAIVHTKAGTTRDVIDESTALNGWPVRLFDTAGLRDTTNRIEKLGIAGAEETIRNADFVGLVIDSVDFDREQFQTLVNEFRPALVIANKTDLARSTEPEVDLHVSATTGTGIDQLIASIGNLLNPELPLATQAIPVSQSQIELVKKILDELEAGRWWMPKIDE